MKRYEEETKEFREEQRAHMQKVGKIFNRKKKAKEQQLEEGGSPPISL